MSKATMVHELTRSAAPVFRKTAIAAVASFAVVLSACETNPFMTTDPYTGEARVNKTTKGAGIGAAAGLLTGIIIGRSYPGPRDRCDAHRGSARGLDHALACAPNAGCSPADDHA